jgi:hypothetical protein
VTFGDVAFGQGLLDRAFEVEKPEGVGDGRSGSTDAHRDLLLRQAELVGQLAIRVSLLDGIEIGALDVFDEGNGQLVALGHLADDRRHAVEAGHLGRTDASFAGHELVAVQDFGDEDRLENAVDGDAGGQ